MSDNLIIIADRVKETTLTTGSGVPFELAGAAGGFSSFDEIYSSGDALFYAVTDGTGYEVGSGIFHSDGSKHEIQRFPFRSSNNNLAHAFTAGTKEIYVTYPATHSVYIGSGVGDLNFPQTSGVAFWSSNNILNYDSDVIWDTTNKRLGLRKSDPAYTIDVGGSAAQSSIQASGFYVGESGVVFPAQNNGDANYTGGNQLIHFEKNETDSVLSSADRTGSDLVIDLSGVVNQVILFKEQNKGTFFAGPTSGCTEPCSPDYPTFRTLDASDIPDLSSLYATASEITTQVTSASGQLESDSVARSGNLQTSIDTNATNITTASGALNTDIQDLKSNLTFNITKNGSTGAFVFDGAGTDSDDNPTISLQRGSTYYFDINTAGDNFYIKTSPTVDANNLYTDGVSVDPANDYDEGIVTFEVPHDAPSILYYSSSASTGMSGIINLSDVNSLKNASTEYTALTGADSTSDDKVLVFDHSVSEYKSMGLDELYLAPSGNSYIKYETILQSSSTGDLGEISFDDTFAYFKTSDGWKRTRIYPFQPADNSNCTTPAPCTGDGEVALITGYNEDPNSIYYGCAEYGACATTTTSTTTTADPAATTTTTTADPSSFTNHVYTWGYNGNSQLGYKTSELNSLAPTQLSSLGNISHLSAGDFHVLAINSGGQLYSWGWNIDGQIGDGSKVDAHLPVLINADKTWVSIAAGDHHSAAITNNGELYTWGGNSTGQLGNGNKASVLTPTRVGSDQTWSKVFTGTSHTLAINTLGELWAWGSNEFGQVGDGTFDDAVLPKKIGVANNWSHLSANLHCLAINTDGQLFSWGRNDRGQLGLNLTTTVTTSSSTDTSGTTSTTSTVPLYENQNAPKVITRRQSDTVIENAGTLENWKAVGAGYQHSLIISQAGELYTSGSNEFGQIGRAESNTFEKLGSERNWNRVAAGNFHSIALSAAGDMYAMGRNTYGQLGNGSTSNLTVLTLISTDFDWDLPEAGYDFTAAIGNIKAAELPTSTTEAPLSNTLTIAAGQTSAVENRLDLRGTAGDALGYNLPADTLGTPAIAKLKIDGSMVAQVTFTSPYDGTPARFTRGGTSYNFTLVAGDIDL